MAFDKWTLLYSALILLVSIIGNIAAQSCGGNYTTNNGVFMSPNYPNAYNISCECNYTISPSTNSSILLTFETYELDRSSGDYVSISCASNSSYAQQKYYWNYNIPPISIPWCSSGRLYFYSDSSRSYSTRGFRVQYQVNTKGCGNTAYGMSGTISSPNYPQNYNNNENCTYSIWATGYSSFTLTFQDFNLESDCQRDWVQISCADSSNILPKFCGSTLPKPAYINNCNNVLVWFHTNNSTLSTGFRLQYSAKYDACGKENYAGLSGFITSPNRHKTYDSMLHCHYYLYPVSSVSLAFQSFDLEPFIDNSSGDYVQIDCYSNSSYGSSSYRGDSLPPLISYTSCSCVHIYLYANAAISGSGFSVKYQVNPLVPYSTLTNAPKNYAIDFGSPLRLYCTSDATGYLPSWTLSRDGADENTTVIASFCVVNSGYTSQYSVEQYGPGVCNLFVASATMVHAGVYTCIDVGLASFSSVVTIMDVDHTVTKQSQVVKGDLLIFKFSMKCNASVSPAPILPPFYYWNITGNSVAISNTTLPNIIISSINVTAEPEVVPSYRFKLIFSAPTNRIGYANNTPAYSHTRVTTSYAVQYWPEESNMIITGHYNGYIAYNGVLQCNVSSNPPSSYIWLDQTNGIYTNEDIIVVTHSGTFTCNASNVIRSKTYWSVKSITVYVLNTTTIPFTTTSSGQVLTTSKSPSNATTIDSVQNETDSNVIVVVLAVLLATCVLGYIGVAVFCIVRRCMGPSKEDHQNTIPSMQDMNCINDSVKTQSTGSAYEHLSIRVLPPESSRTTDTTDEDHYEHLNHGFDIPAASDTLQRQSSLH